MVGAPADRARTVAQRAAGPIRESRQPPGFRAPYRALSRKASLTRFFNKNNRLGWLGREDSNLRMAESKSAALPLGYAPPRHASFGPLLYRSPLLTRRPRQARNIKSCSAGLSSNKRCRPCRPPVRLWQPKGDFDDTGIVPGHVPQGVRARCGRSDGRHARGRPGAGGRKPPIRGPSAPGPSITGPPRHSAPCRFASRTVHDYSCP
jgi:hypothetical protein